MSVLSERDRGRLLAELSSEGQGSGAFVPGILDCREPLDRTSTLMKQVDESVGRHPSSVRRGDRPALARTAYDALFELYEAVGDEHPWAEPASANGSVQGTEGTSL